MFYARHRKERTSPTSLDREPRGLDRRRRDRSGVLCWPVQEVERYRFRSAGGH